MEFEQDYIMRSIKQMIAAIISAILGKENKLYELPLEDQYQAENILLEKFDAGNKKNLEDAIRFYAYLNELENDFLEKHNYSREEIELGIREIARWSGIMGVVEIFDFDSKNK